MSFLKKFWALVKFLFRFLKVFVEANVSVAYVVLAVPPSEVQGRIVQYPVENLSRRETLFMAHLITLTPGTIATEVDLKGKRLSIHFLNSSQIQEDLQEIRDKIEKPLLEVTRG